MRSDDDNRESKTLTSSQRGYLREIAGFTQNRSLFSTAEGYLGLGPLNTRSGDIVCVFLGLYTTIILRPIPEDKFEVVGTAYTHGLLDPEALLGPLPGGWVVELSYSVEDRNKQFKVSFVNKEKGLRTEDDPRLWELPLGWDIETNAEGLRRFRNVETSKSDWPDPRMTSKELERSGVKFQTFRLI